MVDSVDYMADKHEVNLLNLIPDKEERKKDRWSYTDLPILHFPRLVLLLLHLWAWDHTCY